MHVPMEVDHTSGSEPEEEDWDDVDEVRRGSTCYKCGMMGHKAKANDNVETEARGGPKERAKTMKGQGMPRIVLDVRSNRTHVGSVSMGTC